jgi:hypothetical protein
MFVLEMRRKSDCRYCVTSNALRGVKSILLLQVRNVLHYQAQKCIAGDAVRDALSIIVTTSWKRVALQSGGTHR